MAEPDIQGPVIKGPAIRGPTIRGWCPGALQPMLSGDGLVIRIRPDGGRLVPDQAAGISRLALAHGSGLIDLTSRANIQVRGVTEAGYRPLIEGLAALGLIDESPEDEARRNIVTAPFWSPGDGTHELAAELANALTVPDAPANGSFADRYAAYIGAADDLPADLAQNLDHYVHGHRKK